MRLAVARYHVVAAQIHLNLKANFETRISHFRLKG
jgi:hypothetical protein